ncbi:MAG: DUF3303 family protein [Dehalococcoidia bacterium]|jgi:hypothetical protein
MPLYMAELMHGPETCVAANPDRERAGLLADLPEISRANGVNFVGGWAFPVGHRQWYVFEAEDAHAVSKVLFAAKTHHWNGIDIHPVTDFESFKSTVLSPAT